MFNLLTKSGQLSPVAYPRKHSCTSIVKFVMANINRSPRVRRRWNVGTSSTMNGNRQS